MTALERIAREAWVRWGGYAMFTTCSSCGRSVYCRARRHSGPWYCLDCHDQL